MDFRLSYTPVLVARRVQALASEKAGHQLYQKAWFLSFGPPALLQLSRTFPLKGQGRCEETQSNFERCDYSPRVDDAS